MSTGWIKLHRSLLDWEWYDDINARVLLIHLLLSVNYEDKMWKGVEIKKGSMVLSWKSLSLKCGLSVKQCRVAMEKLERSGEVARYRARKYQVVALVKWDKLQQNLDTEGKDEGSKTGNERATKGQKKGNEKATTKEVKNNKNLRKKEIKKSLLSEIKISDVDESEIEYFEIAKAYQELFIKNISENGGSDTHQKNAKYGSYVDPIRLMFENDNVKKEQLQKVWQFLSSPQGNFWKSNILSTKKLREKFSQLIIQANQTETNGNRSQNYGTTDEQLKREASDAYDRFVGNK